MSNLIYSKMKRLVFTDTHQIQALKNDLKKTSDYYNWLIGHFNASQSFHKIESKNDALALLKNPVGYYDSIIAYNSTIPLMANQKVNIEAICNLYQIDRVSYIELIQKVKEKYSYSENDAISFNNGKFEINEAKYLEVCEKFKVFAISPAQIELLDHWANLCRTLNDHMKKGFLLNPPQLAESCNLLFNRFDHEFEIDYKKLADNISNIQ